MIVLHEREKLLQAMNYFIRNTRKCGKTKLFKLLYFLDFEHFKATGRSVTGLEYFAWKMGPVPVSLYEEIDNYDSDLVNAFKIEQISVRNGTQFMVILRPNQQFSAEHFSRRELAIMESLSKEYFDSESDDMIEATHIENTPWDQIYNREGKRNRLIPYKLSIPSNELDMISKVADERQVFIECLDESGGSLLR